MLFHNNFEDRYSWCDTPNWFELKSKLYADICTWEPRKLDEVFFHFKAPNAGWMDFDVYVNGEKKHSTYFSAAFDPFRELRVWMEDVVNDFKLCSSMAIEIEGRTLIFHYENIKLCDVSVRRKFINEDREKDEWEFTDADTHPTIGVFCLYDSACDALPIICMCSAKQLVQSLYGSLLEYATGEYKNKIPRDWYYMDLDYDDDDNEWKPLCDNWDFYNIIKSPLIEWFIYSKDGYRHKCHKFKPTPKIKETIHMWAEWGGGLFWQGKCCGNADGFYIETGCKRIELTDIPELREWYDEFDNRAPEDIWPEDEYNKWFAKGWELAKLVRKRLPENVDLFYQWRKYALQSPFDGNKEIPLIVPNDNLEIKKSTKNS